MAGIKNGDDYSKGERFKIPALLQLICLGVGGGGTLLFFLLRFLKPDDAGAMGYSWLLAVVFFLSLAVGGLFWTMLHHATNSGWGTVVRRLMENLAILIPVTLLLAIPLLLPSMGFRDSLWEWLPERAAVLEHAEKTASTEQAEYVEQQKAAIEAAKKDVDQAKKEIADSSKLSPGHRNHLERKVDALQKKVTLLEEEDLSEAGAMATLIDKHFVHENALLFKKRGYLNETFWWVRQILYLLVLGGIAGLLRCWSVKLDKDGDPKRFRWMRRWSCGLLLFFATAWTFLVFDWLMGLDYAWFSTMWGVYLFAGAALSSMAFLIILLTLLRAAGYLKDVVTMEHYHIMGKLLLTFVIFWAYIAYSQYFLIWYANITEETKFFLTRNTDFWNGYTIALLVIGHFFIPFTALLLQQVKKMPNILSLIAGWCLLMHLFDVYWIIIPERGPSLTAGQETLQMLIPGAWVYDLLALVSVAGIFGYFLLRMLGSASLYPCRDPRLDESLNLVN